MPRITKADLFNLAQSPKPDDSKRAFELYQAWVKAASNLEPQDRINSFERMLLDQIFKKPKPRK
jgi:hypothetical protein